MPLSKNPVPEKVNPVKTLDVSVEDILKDKSSNVNEVIRAVLNFFYKNISHAQKNIYT